MGEQIMHKKSKGDLLSLAQPASFWRPK